MPMMPRNPLPAVRVALVVATLALAGCQTAAWTRLDNPEAIAVAKSTRAFVPPAGWVRWNNATSGVVVTRDGTPIQYIRAAEMSHDEAFLAIRKKSNADLLPNELAELLIAARKAMPGMSGLVVKSNEPATFGGLDGVRLGLAYRDERGASFDHLMYAAAETEGVFMIEYHALSKHYFARDLPAFEKAVASLMADPKGAKATKATKAKK
jgi:hypothetical protein